MYLIIFLEFRTKVKCLSVRLSVARLHHINCDRKLEFFPIVFSRYNNMVRQRSYGHKFDRRQFFLKILFSFPFQFANDLFGNIWSLVGLSLVEHIDFQWRYQFQPPQYSFSYHNHNNSISRNNKRYYELNNHKLLNNYSVDFTLVLNKHSSFTQRRSITQNKHRIRVNELPSQYNQANCGAQQWQCCCTGVPGPPRPSAALRGPLWALAVPLHPQEPFKLPCEQTK